MSKARILADLISDSQITASEIVGLELNSIQEGDTVVQVSDTGSGGKVVVRVDGADNAEFNANGMVIPKGTTAQRDPAAVVGSLRYNTTTGFFESFTGSGWGSIATPPSITSITPSNFNGEAGATFTVNGAFFDADTTAVFKGADGTEYAAATVTFVNSTQITLTNATNLPVANEPFRVKVTNGAGLSVESVQGIDAGSVPAFTTAAGSIATTTRWNESVSVTVQATDAESTISGYSVTEGNLPAGLTLNGTTGAITGTSTAQTTTTYTFTVEATDSAGNANTRQFNIQIVNAAPVWNSPAEGSTQDLDKDAASSITLDATDPEGETVSYTSGTLPTGLSLSGNVISGTPTVVANTSVAVAASDGFASSVRNFYINVLQLPSGPEVLLALGATQISSSIYRMTTSGLYTVRLAGFSGTVHVIGAGGWSGIDGMGYGNCGGGGGGGGAKTSFAGLTSAQFQVGAGVGGYTYDYGVDGSQEPEYVVSNYSPGEAQKSWFVDAGTLFGEGGRPGWYGAKNRSLVDPILGLPSGNGGEGGGSAANLGSSSGGYGGGTNWNGDGNFDSYSPTTSTFGGAGGGDGNNTYGGHGASGALGGEGGRGGVPNGNNNQNLWRENTAGTLGGGNGGQAKWMTNNETGPFTIVNSCNGVVQFEFD